MSETSLPAPLDELIDFAPGNTLSTRTKRRHHRCEAERLTAIGSATGKWIYQTVARARFGHYTHAFIVCTVTLASVIANLVIRCLLALAFRYSFVGRSADAFVDAVHGVR